MHCTTTDGEDRIIKSQNILKLQKCHYEIYLAEIFQLYNATKI